MRISSLGRRQRAAILAVAVAATGTAGVVATQSAHASTCNPIAASTRCFSTGGNSA